MTEISDPDDNDEIHVWVLFDGDKEDICVPATVLDSLGSKA